MSFDIFRAAWIPTDCGILSPSDALLKAREIRWPRGDWNGATLLFLHAMLQTAVVLNDRCESEGDWEALANTSPESIEDWWDGFDAGDLPYQCKTARNEVAVRAIMIGTPGENALVKNSDVLSWRENVPTTLSREEAMVAIIANQCFGVPLGNGYYEGIRGRKPVTVLLEPSEQNKTLFERLWLNVLSKDAWEEEYPAKTSFAFPWSKDLPDEIVTGDLAHPLEMLWQLPRRWRMVEGDDGRIHAFMMENHGRNYALPWTHPLTPYYETKENGWTAQKVTQHAALQDWASLSTKIYAQGKKIPLVIKRALEDRGFFEDNAFRIRYFGWALGGADAPGTWAEYPMPFYRNVNAEAAEQSIAFLDKAKKTLRFGIESIVKGERFKHLAKKKMSQLDSDVEAAFYTCVSTNNWAEWNNEVISSAVKIAESILDGYRVNAFDFAVAMKKMKDSLYKQASK